MKIVIRHFPDRKKPCLVLESGAQGIILATFRNEEMENLYKYVLCGNNTIEINSWDERLIDEVLEEMKND